jgi:murein DD-endopeptidase MepM/ murein hydrolase activator NlpD
VPGGPGGGTAEAVAPPDASALDQSFSYPEDGSIVSTGPVSATASTGPGGERATARSTASVTGLQLFGGEITAAKLSDQAVVSAGPRDSYGRLTAPPGLTLSVLGQSMSPTPNLQIPLADWGYAVVLEQAVDPTAPIGRRAYRASVTALDVRLILDHGGLPAGSQILVGYSESYAKAKSAPPPVHPKKKVEKKRTKTTPREQRHPSPAPRTRAPAPKVKVEEPQLSPFGPPPVKAPPKQARPNLKGGGYVFPVFGPSSFTDTFGAARADTGWHHGDDIFAPLGAPIVAVANGTVFSVGWNDLGGNRLWLSDRQGNQFYYAHLSAFSPLAVNGARVNAGDVLGFVGNTGDAEATPYHLHFEIHPVSMLGMGYDGVVDPTSYLLAWQHLRNLGFSGGASGYAPRTVVRPSAPQPGMVLLQAVDISSASSLSPASIKKALEAGGSGIIEGESVLLGVPKLSKNR